MLSCFLLALFSHTFFSHISFHGMLFLKEQTCSCLRAFAFAFPSAQNTFPSGRLFPQTFAWFLPSSNSGFCSNVTFSTTHEGPAMTTLSKIAVSLSCFLFLHSIYHYLMLDYICICLLSPLPLNVNPRDWVMTFLILFFSVLSSDNKICYIEVGNKYLFTESQSHVKNYILNKNKSITKKCIQQRLEKIHHYVLEFEKYRKLVFSHIHFSRFSEVITFYLYQKKQIHVVGKIMS